MQPYFQQNNNQPLPPAPPQVVVILQAPSTFPQGHASMAATQPIQQQQLQQQQQTNQMQMVFTRSSLDGSLGMQPVFQNQQPFQPLLQQLQQQPFLPQPEPLLGGSRGTSQDAGSSASFLLVASPESSGYVHSPGASLPATPAVSGLQNQPLQQGTQQSPAPATFFVPPAHSQAQPYRRNDFQPLRAQSQQQHGQQATHQFSLTPMNVTMSALSNHHSSQQLQARPRALSSSQRNHQQEQQQQQQLQRSLASLPNASAPRLMMPALPTLLSPQQHPESGGAAGALTSPPAFNLLSNSGIAASLGGNGPAAPHLSHPTAAFSNHFTSNSSDSAGVMGTFAVLSTDDSLAIDAATPSAGDETSGASGQRRTTVADLLSGDLSSAPATKATHPLPKPTMAAVATNDDDGVRESSSSSSEHHPPPPHGLDRCDTRKEEQDFGFSPSDDGVSPGPPGHRPDGNEAPLPPRRPSVDCKAICRHFVDGRCNRRKCRFSHGTDGDE